MLKILFILLFLHISINAVPISITNSVGTACNAPENCLYENDCIRDTSQNLDICICRKDRIHESADNAAKCTDGYMPLGLSPLEGGYFVDPITMSYEKLPDDQFSTSHVDPANLPHYARLNNTKAWCLLPSISPPVWLMIDLVVPTDIRMIASQGKDQTNLFYVKIFKLEIGDDINSLDNVKHGSDDLFNTLDEYNIFDPEITGRFLKILPADKKNLYCMRIELYGNRTINECDEIAPINHCHVNYTKCTDTPGAYKCKCDYGYHDQTGDGSNCIPVNECSDTRPEYKNNCSQHAICTDKTIGFGCVCKNGFEGDGYYCEDINECKNGPADPRNDCHVKADCNNTVGGFKCTCKSGYKGTGNIVCKNINECKTGTHLCHGDAVCTDTIGSYICRCREGFIGSGFICSDINECNDASSCHVNAACTNKQGQYQCQCKDGFNGNGKWCEDVNECDKSPCKVGEKCHNLVGNYTCMCPSFMPLQKEYKNEIERTILDEVVSNYRDISKEDYRYPIDYHAHIVRTIYQLLMRTYDYHFEENRYSFSIVKVVGNSFAMELYDLRCTDIQTAYFPSLCHNQYYQTVFDNVTDIVEMPLNSENEDPFEHWATEPPPKAPKIGDTTPTAPPLPTPPGTPVNVSANATTTPKPSTGPYNCPTSYFFEKDQATGKFSTPNFKEDDPEAKYPNRVKCVWKIIAEPRHNAYVEFDTKTFEIEFDRKCLNDYVEIRDGNEEDTILDKYCGQQYATAQRSTRQNLTIIFYSDNYYQYRGFSASFHFLTTRVSLGCITYNPMASLPSSKQKLWEYEMRGQDPSVYVPVSRLLACQQHPKCAEHKEKLHAPIRYTFEHFRFDRNDKKCIRWTLLKFGRSYDTYDCWKIKTNKTHTVCECKSWGIVGVLGRLTHYQEAQQFVQFTFGNNSFVSIIFVVIALVVTILFLFLKDQWGAVIIQVFTMKEYDSGRVIQLHVVLSTLFAEIFFSVITFNVTGSTASCFILGFLFYYFLQTVFFWLFIYALFLASRVREIFDSNTFNSYKIYLIVGYVIPFLVTLTISGLNVITGDENDELSEKLCWLMFKGTTVWGFSGVIITLGVGSLILLFTTIYSANDMENGIILQEKCIRTVFTTFFVLLTTICGAQILKEQKFGWEYMFSLCNLLQGFSIAIMYCILRREDPIIKSNQIGAVPDFDEDEKPVVVDEDDESQFKDISPDNSSDEENEMENPEIEIELPKTPAKETKVKLADPSLYNQDNIDVEEDQEAMVDEPNPISDSDSDQEIMFRADDEFV